VASFEDRVAGLRRALQVYPEALEQVRCGAGCGGGEHAAGRWQRGKRLKKAQLAAT
jgi:hypothetical protein